jgi:hypothetical protein
MPGERCVFPWCGEQDFHTHQVDGSLVPRLEVYEDLGPTIERAGGVVLDQTPDTVVYAVPPERPAVLSILSWPEPEPLLWEGDQA